MRAPGDDTMNNLGRFEAIVHFEEPDYVPIFGFPGAPGMSHGCMAKTHARLVETGMPPHVGGKWRLGEGWRDTESWMRYWGTCGPTSCCIQAALGIRGLREKRRIEGEFEIIESESGALRRQVIDNDITYSMPQYVEYSVRDRASWEFYKERMTPTDSITLDEIRLRARNCAGRKDPGVVGCGGTYGSLRSLMGPERLSFMLYDDPDLVHEIMDWRLDLFRRYVAPVIEAVRPEILQIGEDLCYNHGMLLSPAQFREFCGPFYTEVCAVAREAGVDIVAVDTDGNAMEFTGLAESYGVNGIYPYEVKAGNDLFALRQAHPRFVLFGWLEKETVNEGNERLIKQEIMSKVPPLLEKGGYFPNGDHGIQPLVTFENLCRFMTLLHEVNGNPEGEFPRMDPHVS